MNCGSNLGKYLMGLDNIKILKEYPVRSLKSYFVGIDNSMKVMDLEKIYFNLRNKNLATYDEKNFYKQLHSGLRNLLNPGILYRGRNDHMWREHMYRAMRRYLICDTHSISARGDIVKPLEITVPSIQMEHSQFLMSAGKSKSNADLFILVTVTPPAKDNYKDKNHKFDLKLIDSSGKDASDKDIQFIVKSSRGGMKKSRKRNRNRKTTRKVVRHKKVKKSRRVRKA